jgi:hypothetical protein
MQIEDHASTVAGPLRPATRTGSPQTAKMALFETANDTAVSMLNRMRVVQVPR